MEGFVIYFPMIFVTIIIVGRLNPHATTAEAFVIGIIWPVVYAWFLLSFLLNFLLDVGRVGR